MQFSALTQRGVLFVAALSSALAGAQLTHVILKPILAYLNISQGEAIATEVCSITELVMGEVIKGNSPVLVNLLF